MHTSVNTYVCMNTYTARRAHEPAQRLLYVYIYIYTHVNVCTYLYVYMCKYKYVYEYIQRGLVAAGCAHEPS